VTSARRLAAICLSTAVLALTAVSPAVAARRDDGDDPGEPLSIALALGLFVGVPLLVYAIVAAFIYLPGMRSPKTTYSQEIAVPHGTGLDAQSGQPGSPAARQQQAQASRPDPPI
jgi:hypothetical protein